VHVNDAGTPRPDAGPGLGGDPPAELVELCTGPSGAVLRAVMLAGVAMPLLTAGRLEEDPDR
jgi:hypothetical protein